ncbi:carboxypeptidase-like regulatory domain-containing protein [Hyphomonas sp.]|uniref:carboxypeptidase-like regulatory domain-containing protein n=1 Tax=Hyphomonas sp. TaxID=87 RepID=UPI00391B6FD5
MSRLILKTFALGVACLYLTACVTRREFVVAPETGGVVIDAETGAPVEGAEVRFGGVDAIASVVTGPDGRFALPGLKEKRTIVAMPMGGVFRDAARVQASAPGRAEAFATAAFIQGGRPASALYRVTVLMFPEDAAETALHALMRECTEGAEQAHALQFAGYVSGIDPANPPGWLDEDTVQALQEHLSLALPASGFQSCAQMNEAYALFRAQLEPLEALERATYIEKLPPHLRPAAESGD